MEDQVDPAEVFRYNVGNKTISRGAREDRIAHHNGLVDQMEANEGMLGHGRRNSVASTYAFERKAKASTANLNDLKEVQIKDLSVGQVHHAKVLFGRVVARTLYMNSVQTIIEDQNGNVANIALYNAPGVHCLQDAQQYLPVGREFAVKEPFYKLRADGTKGIRVDNIEDIVLDVMTPQDPLIAERLEVILRDRPEIGQKQLREELQAEGHAVSQKRMRKILMNLRTKAPDSKQEVPPQDRQAEEQQNPLHVFERNFQMHRFLRGSEVLASHDDGNVAFKAGAFWLADCEYTKALEAGREEALASRENGPEGGEDGVPLWILFSNRGSARMHLRRPDEALQDALEAHQCAPMEVVKPVLRCAEAMAAMHMHEELHRFLAAAAQKFPRSEATILEKRHELAPAATLRVGEGQEYASISEAVDAAPPGAEILVSPGTYHDSLLLERSVTIRSVGAVRPTEDWVHGAPAGQRVELWVSDFHAVHASLGPDASICLEGLRIVSEAPQDKSFNALEALGGVVILRNCSLTSTSGPIVGAGEASRVILQHCAIHDGTQGGLIAVDGATLVLQHVRCCRAGGAGLEVRNAGQAKIDQCSFFDNGNQGIIVSHNAGAFHAARTEIHSNRFESGVLVEENPEGAVFKSCKIHGNGFAGVVSQRGGVLNMVETEVHSNVEGILVHDNGNATIDSCDVSSNRACGIVVGDGNTGSVTITQSRVCNNHTQGILLGTGLGQRVSVQDTVEHGNRGMPPGKPDARRKAVQRAQHAKDVREWAANKRKPVLGLRQATLPSSEPTAFDFAGMRPPVKKRKKKPAKKLDADQEVGPEEILVAPTDDPTPDVQM